MEFLFSNCSSLLIIPDISDWKTNNLKKMENIFIGCNSLISLPNISKWNINKIEKISLSSFEKENYSVSISLNNNESSQMNSSILSMNLEENGKKSFLKNYTNFAFFNNNDDELKDYYENFFN